MLAPPPPRPLGWSPRRAVELATELVRLRSVDPPDASASAEIANLLGARLQDAGFAVTPVDHSDGLRSIVARLDGHDGSPSICFSGHLDTVPVNAKAWTRDPFAGECDGDRLYGRGASDMKGGVAALVTAAEERAALGAGRAGLVLVLTASEESGCASARELAARPDLLGGVGALVVAEPTGNSVRVAHKGVVWLRVHARGRAAHGSQPQLGCNAVVGAARAVVQLHGHPLSGVVDAQLGGVTLNVGGFAGGSAINVVPDSATLELDVRTVPGVGEAEVVAAVQERIGDELEIEPLLSLPSVFTSADHPWIHEVEDTVRAVTGAAAVPSGIGYFTDASILTPALGGVPTVICGPGDPAQAHQSDEHCSIGAIAAAAEIYLDLARRWGGI
jgi:succinyl-diaminopimelate desuccinylase